jgi:hypothetical protein
MAAIAILHLASRVESHGIQGEYLSGFPVHLAFRGPSILLLSRGAVAVGHTFFLEHEERHSDND